MFQVQRLMQRPRSFESLCGLIPTEFTYLAQRLEPLWVSAHRLSLLRVGRQRQIGAGRPFKLNVPHRLFLTLLYLRHYLPMHLLGLLFEMDAANVCRNIHALLPLLEQAVPAPFRARTLDSRKVTPDARSRPTTRGVVGCAHWKTFLTRSRRSLTSSSTVLSSPEVNPRRRTGAVLGRKP